MSKGFEFYVDYGSTNPSILDVDEQKKLISFEVYVYVGSLFDIFSDNSEIINFKLSQLNK